METRKVFSTRIKVIDGNEAAAQGVLLCKPDIVCAYPITPQTPLVEALYQFSADGLLQAEMVEVEGEHSAISVLVGASAAGARTFTATSSQGLAFMYEPYVWASTLRLPIVMVIATREMMAPGIVASGEQDAILVRDAGWIQIHAESCQEILDSIIMAYKLAEDPEILVPVSICYDGYYLSHLSEPVEIPDQEQVTRFLPPLKLSPKLDPQTPMTFSPYAAGEVCTEYRVKHCAALQRAKAKIEEIEEEFHEIFGRKYGGQIEEYQCQDADIVLLTMGSCTGTAKVVVEKKRNEGLNVGLVKVRMFRPFPRERLVHVLRGKKALGVIDRSVSFGWDSGALFVELKAALSDLEIRMPVLNFIGGLAGLDITQGHIERVIIDVHLASQARPYKEVTWLSLE